MAQFDLPNRWAQKIDIYQQIRSGKGISRFKKSWKYERAYLLWAYRSDNQHLNSWLAFDGFITNIANATKTPHLDRGSMAQTVGNLLIKGFITIKPKVLKDEFDNLREENLQYLKVRTTLSGLLVGEVLEESKHFGGKYKYEFFLNLIWVILFYAGFITVTQLFDLNNFLSNKYLWDMTNSNSIGIFFILCAFIWPLIQTKWLLCRECKEIKSLS
jgi:hypothetical protein